MLVNRPLVVQERTEANINITRLCIRNVYHRLLPNAKLRSNLFKVFSKFHTFCSVYNWMTSWLFPKLSFIVLYVASGVSKELRKGDNGRKTVKLFCSVWLVDIAKWADIYILARCPLVTGIVECNSNRADKGAPTYICGDMHTTIFCGIRWFQRCIMIWVYTGPVVAFCIRWYAILFIIFLCRLRISAI